MSEDNKDNPWVVVGLYGGLGFQLSASVVVGLFLGHYLDGKWGTSPWLAVTGLILGAVGGFYNLFRVLSLRENKK